jgi:hypothetical protein
MENIRHDTCMRMHSFRESQIQKLCRLKGTVSPDLYISSFYYQTTFLNPLYKGYQFFKEYGNLSCAYCIAGKRKNGFIVLHSHKIIVQNIWSYRKLCNPGMRSSLEV